MKKRMYGLLVAGCVATTGMPAAGMAKEVVTIIDLDEESNDENHVAEERKEMPSPTQKRVQALEEKERSGWTKLTAATGEISLSNGNYYLAEDVILPASLRIEKKVTLDLNGHMLAFRGNLGKGNRLQIAHGGDLTLQDSQATASAKAGIGCVNGTVENNGTLRGNGTMKGTVLNEGSIKGGIFEGTVTNLWMISGGTFRGNVTNTCSTIEEGTFVGSVANGYGSIIGKGTFRGAVTNEGILEGGTFQGKVTNAFDGTITGGTFAETVYNQYGSTISDGTFKGTVLNEGTICGGAFRMVSGDSRMAGGF